MIGELAAACAELARLDQGRLLPGQDYSIDLQATRSQAERQGRQLGPLISYVNPDAFQRPTYRLFLALLDNYQRATGTAETVGTNELREQSEFLDAIMATPVMQYTQQWLAQRQRIGGDPRAFKDALTQMWFALYRREVQNDSSGFEHVFLGESDNGQVKGLHSWIQFHLEERRGNLQYRGYLHPRSGPKANEQDRVLSVHFAWMGEAKAVSSMILGSSPEFEIALYTLCFLGGAEENIVYLDNYQLKIKCYRIRSNRGDKIGTAYPELLSKGEGGAPVAVPHNPHPPQQQHHYQPQSQQHQPQAWGGQGQQQHQQPAWGAPSQPQQPHYQQQQNNTDGTAQGCFSFLGAVLNIFCANNKKQRN